MRMEYHDSFTDSVNEMRDTINAWQEYATDARNSSAQREAINQEVKNATLRLNSEVLPNWNSASAYTVRDAVDAVHQMERSAEQTNDQLRQSGMHRTYR